MKFLLLLLLLCIFYCTHSQCLNAFNRHKTTKSKSYHLSKGINFGIRVNNLVLIDVHHKDEDSWRKLYYRQFFPKLNGIHLLYYVKRGDYSHISSPKEHLILVFKNWGTITYNKDNKSDLHGIYVPKVHKIPLIIVIPMEMIFIISNIDNWFHYAS